MFPRIPVFAHFQWHFAGDLEGSRLETTTMSYTLRWEQGPGAVGAHARGRWSTDLWVWSSSWALNSSRSGHTTSSHFPNPSQVHMQLVGGGHQLLLQPFHPLLPHQGSEGSGGGEWQLQVPVCPRGLQLTLGMCLPFSPLSPSLPLDCQPCWLRAQQQM